MSSSSDDVSSTSSSSSSSSESDALTANGRRDCRDDGQQQEGVQNNKNESVVAKKTLFDDDDDDVGREEAVDLAVRQSTNKAEEHGDVNRLRINQKWAKAYTERKQAEELKTARQEQEEYDDDDASSSSDEDEPEPLSTDVNFLKTLNALRSKDSRIYDPSTKFFDGEGETDADAAADAKGSGSIRIKRKTFKDVVREQVLDQMENDDSDKDDDYNDDEAKAGTIESRSKHALEYDQEQTQLRSAFLDATTTSDEDRRKISNTDDDDDDGDDVLLVVKRRRVDSETHDDENELQREFEALERTKEMSALRQELKDPHGEIQDGEQFLLDFFKKKKWIDRNELEIESNEQMEDDDEAKRDASGTASININNVINDEEDENELDKQDDFEAAYNFRFEQAVPTSGADFSITSYARGGGSTGIDYGSLRRPDDARKLARQQRKERKAKERKAKEEKLRRLKNAKQAELKSKLAKVKEVLGTSSQNPTKNKQRDKNVDDGINHQLDEDAMMKLIEGDFDPEKFEEIMNAQYNDEFYEKDDAEWKSDVDVKKSLLKDEDGELLTGGELDGQYDDVEEYGDEGYGPDGDDEDGYDEKAAVHDEYYDDEDGDAVFAVKEGESVIERKVKAKLQEELYKLDYEDMIGDMPTRFKYREVEKNDYGLSTSEILMARDSTLKGFVSLKKMAPYRDDGEYRVYGKKRKRFRDMLRHDLEEEEAPQQQPPKSSELDHVSQPGKVADDNEEQETTHKKRRRKKKGKKKEKTVEGEEEESGLPTNEVQEVSQEETRTDDVKLDGKPNNEIKKEKKQKRKKKGAKKKKIKLQLEGVTRTRLEAYGL